MATSSNHVLRSRISVWLMLALLLAVIVCANIWRPAVAAGNQELLNPADMTFRVWPGKPLAAPTTEQPHTADQPHAISQAPAREPVKHASLKRTQPGL